jgi:hypothetical protein
MNRTPDEQKASMYHRGGWPLVHAQAASYPLGELISTQQPFGLDDGAGFLTELVTPL